MANGHGGVRIGAGGKKKSLSDKILEGNPTEYGFLAKHPTTGNAIPSKN